MDSSAVSRRSGISRPKIAERIWDAARVEFSRRGYQGARVQAVARGASCNVALMYRHWASKRALYLEILREVWLSSAREFARILEDRAVQPESVVAAYLDAMMRDPMGAQILIREILDGAPFLAHLASTDPSILEPIRRNGAALSRGTSADLDPILAVVTVCGFAALIASTREAARPLVTDTVAPDAWRRQVANLLVHGLAAPVTQRSGQAADEERRPADSNLSPSQVGLSDAPESRRA